ncbi:MAG: hypothetical protein ACRDT1_01370, partial [Micromonosporaceae bacterium]
VTAVCVVGLGLAMLYGLPAGADLLDSKSQGKTEDPAKKDSGNGEATNRVQDPIAMDESLTDKQRQQLRKVRAATEKYQNYQTALADGYHKPDPWVCYESEKGAMGYHHLMTSRVDNEFDITKPELMIYMPNKKGTLELVAVEYMQPDADQDLGTDEDRPSLFGGVEFDGPMEGHEPGMPRHYDLHVWIYKHNPNGVFNQWNPAHSCPRDADIVGMK